METSEQWAYEATADAVDEGEKGTTFAAVATALQDHGDRLIELAEACRASAHDLAEREARVGEREHALTEAWSDLDRRREELENWKRELDEAAARAHDAEMRITEAAEREAALRSVAETVLARYATG
jgi:chromosome segregation ATPase